MPVLKKASPEAQKVRASEKRKLAREAARSEERRQASIREQMRQATRKVVSDDEQEMRNRIAKGLGGALQVVASSYPEWNNEVTIAATLSSELRAYTNWDEIHVAFPLDKFVVESDGNFDNAVTRSSVSQFLGVGYHEVGHILYTVSYRDLLAFFAKNHSDLGLDDSAQTAWNALEDQRMETLVTNASPDIAAYFTAMFINLFQGSDQNGPGELWWLAAGRLYLPSNVRSLLRSECVAKYGEPVVAEIDRIVKDYETATTLFGLGQAVLEYKALFAKTHPSEGGNAGAERMTNHHGNTASHDRMTYRRSDALEEAEKKAAGNAVPESRWEEAEEASKDSGDAPGSDDGGQSTDTDGGNGAGHDNSGPKAGTTEGTESASKALQDAVDEAREAIANDHRVTDTLTRVREATASGSMPYIDSIGSVMSEEDVRKAEALIAEFQTALEIANAYNNPTWRRRQDQGAVDPLAYRTRRSGDPDFRRRRTGEGSKGFDVSISLLLDVSGSMGGDPIHTLSIAQYAIKQACWNLGIPCTVTAYSSTAALVSDSKDAPEPVGLVASGGTNPVGALRAAPNQREDRADHLVLILTDGDCDGGRTEVETLQSEGSYVLGVAVGWGSTKSLRDNLGCDEVREIQTCDALPRIVEDWLVRTVTTK